MPALELHRVDGTIDTKPLSRTQPLMIGKQSFNDICIPDDGVGPMHCRVLWNKTTFEVTAATASGVEVNGTSVAHARLQPGDVIRIGSLDIVYVDEAAVEDSAAIQFQEASPADDRNAKRNLTAPPKPPRAPAIPSPEDSQPLKTERSRARPEPEPKPKAVEEMSLFEGPVYTDSQEIPSSEADEESAGETAGTGKGRRSYFAKPSEKPASVASPAGAMMGLSTRARPGEQDIFRSPLVLGLSIGGLALVLVTGIFWFLIGREQSNRLYDRALRELNDGQYAQSVASFEKFLQDYPGHSLHKQAERGLGKALIQKEISGATPAWKRGLEQLHALITRHRNESDFADLHSTLHRYAEEIALGSARSAETARDADLLTVSEDAQVVLERYADSSSPPAAALARIKEARVAAVIAIGKQKVFDDGMAAVDAALAAKQPMIALSEREKLVRAYDGFASQKRVKEALQKALDLERSVITTDDKERAAESTDPSQPARPPALGLFHTRIRTDESSQGRVAYVLAKDCCYAVDSVTGELTWRRITGFDPPFFPVLAAGSQPELLLYDSYDRSLICCQPATGALIWRQKLDGRPRSAPLVHEGQIYVPTDDRSLCRIDLETGRLTERVTFSQNVHGPPTLAADGNHLLIPGEMSMIYALSMRPLAAAATTFTDHVAGSLSAPPLGLGKLFLLCENDKSNSANLRLWDAGNPKLPMPELADKAVRVRGQVRESAVLRGNQLVVPSSGEHLAAFTVTDEAGRAGLVTIAQYQVREDEDIEKRRASRNQEAGNDEGAEPAVRIGPRVPLYLALGPDQQIWGAGSAFRRFEIGPDSIRMDSTSAAQGIASQRLQAIGDQFFVGRKAIFHDAVTFSAIDRDKMLSPWRIVLGARVLELGATRDGGAVAINEAGQVAVISADRLRQGGTDLKSMVELAIPAGVDHPLISSLLHDGRIFLAAVGATAQVWIVGQTGQVESSATLAKGERVQVPGVLLDQGLVIPLPGRLKVLPMGSGKKSVQDWLAPVGDQAPSAWKFLVRADSDEVLACNAKGTLARIQVRMTDVPHLAEAAKVQLDQPLEIAPILRGDTLLVVDVAGTAQQLNWRSFDVEGKKPFAAPVRGHWTTASSWLIWSGDGKLQSVSDGRDLPVRWSLDLKGLEPAGAPWEDGDLLWIACRNGTVLAVDARTGVESRRQRVPQSLTHGVKKLGDAMYAVSCDGALYRLDSNGH